MSSACDAAFMMIVQAMEGAEPHPVRNKGKRPLFPCIPCSALSLAEYLLAKGPIVKDDDTVGYSNTERLKITLLDQGGRSVMQVLTEEIAP